MKHTIEVKLPRLFGKKAKEEKAKDEVTLETDNEKVSKVLKVAVPVVAGVTIGYLVGHNRGMAKTIKSGNVFIIK